MGKNSTLQNISEHITELVSSIENGKGNKETIDRLLDTIKQMEELLYIMRYKAYEEELGIKTKVQEGVEKAIRLKFENGDISPNQISLIDVIQEVAPEVDLSTIPKEKTEESRQEAPTKIVPPVDVETQKPAAKSSINFSAQPSNSVNEKHASTSDEKQSVAEKLQRTPISDLKSAIGINQRFLFINELFQQNADEYNASIEFINNAPSLDDAQIYINQKLISRYNWDIEEKHVINFMELVERKFL